MRVSLLPLPLHLPLLSSSKYTPEKQNWYSGAEENGTPHGSAEVDTIPRGALLLLQPPHKVIYGRQPAENEYHQRDGRKTGGRSRDAEQDRLCQSRCEVVAC